MRKNSPILLLMVAAVLFIAGGPLYAAEVPSWQITLHDNGTIAERVTVPAVSTGYQAPEWKVLSEGNQLVAERTTKNWAAYMKLNDRLPLQIHQKNYFLWQNINIKKNSEVKPVAGMAALVFNNDKSNIVFQVPGFIGATIGNQVTEDKAELNVPAVNQLRNGQSLLQVTTLNGLMIGIVLFVVGFLVVMIVFANRLRKVNRMIEEEYSLEKAALQLEMEDQEETEETEDEEGQKE